MLDALEQIERNVSRGPWYEADSAEDPIFAAKPVQLIAFYLPQFHPIEENDRWWGKGFTEWTNVTRGLPRFVGHYQPRLPGELGFYDLRLNGTLRRQAELAKKYGVSGFCFHHYWFSGHQILDMPIRSLIAQPDIELPFCVNWANEPWTRRWDGHDKDVLLGQNHSAEDDLAFVKSLEPFLRDHRYIRVAGRPLIMIYRPGIMPEPAATVRRWRAYLTDHGLGNPYIVMPQAFSDGDPRKYGMDAAVGFPPFWAGWDSPRIQGDLEPLSPGHACEVVSYEEMARRMVAEHPKDFTLHPGVCPSWDNEARRPGRGFCFQGSTPKIYGKWLERACRNAIEANGPEERMVFINAWNEWAEGAYLEPDRHFGFAYLAETSRVLKGLSTAASRSTEEFDPSPADRSAPSDSAAKRIRHKLAGKLEGLARRLR